MTPPEISEVHRETVHTGEHSKTVGATTTLISMSETGGAQPGGLKTLGECRCTLLILLIQPYRSLAALNTIPSTGITGYGGVGKGVGVVGKRGALC